MPQNTALAPRPPLGPPPAGKRLIRHIACFNEAPYSSKETLMKSSIRAMLGAALVVAAALNAAPAAAQKTIKFIPEADLKSLDPI
jgi:hypothetical protein